MNQPDLKEWFQLYGAARKLIRQGTGHQASRRLLHLIVSPSFTGMEGFEVFKRSPNDGDTYFCTHTCWIRDVDHRQYSQRDKSDEPPAEIAPTIKMLEFELPADQIQTFVAEFQGCLVPAMSSANILGLDGTTTELILGTGFQQSYFRWWSHQPPEWLELVGIADRLLQFLRRSAEKEAPESDAAPDPR